MNPASHINALGILKRHFGKPSCGLIFAAACLQLAPAMTFAQAPAANSAGPTVSQPIVITLVEAIHRVQASDPAFAAAKAASRSAALDQSIAVAGLLPTGHAANQNIYVQPNGVPSTGAPLPRFVSADARPWEYIAQGMATETLSPGGAVAVRRAHAAAAQAAAEQEIARRGLVAGVTALFYTALAADHKVAVAQEALKEAAQFTKITQDREQAREAAHADVIKAQLEEQGRQREAENAHLESEKAHLELGVLLFSDPRTAYTLNAPEATPPLASRSDIDAAAAKNNPELERALAALNVSNADVLAARLAFLPDLQLDVIYGIDANQFGVNGPLTETLNGHLVQPRNLGYSASVAVNIPVWDWLATEHEVKQSEIRHEVAQVALTATERQLIARLDETYSEAAAARDQLASLDESVTTAAESLRLTTAAYEGGEGTVLEVVDAQNAYIVAENARENGRVRYEIALAGLQTLTGTM